VLDRISRHVHFTGRGELVLDNELGDHTNPSTLPPEAPWMGHADIAMTMVYV
jgi:hypothetical protein